MLYLDFSRDGLGDADGRVNDIVLTVGMGMSDTGFISCPGSGRGEGYTRGFALRNASSPPSLAQSQCL